MARLKWSALAVLMAVATGPAHADSPAGNWLVEDGTGVVAITPCGDTLCGRIAGIMIDHARDRTPVDHAGRSQCNLPLLGPLIPDSPGVWHTTITDPTDGGLHPALIRVDARGQLRLRGFVFIPLLGQTQVWTRYRGPLPADCRIARY